MRRAKKETPTPAATGMGAGYRKPGSNRFTPYIANPFDPATAFEPLPAVYVKELGRRDAAYRRAARAA